MTEVTVILAPMGDQSVTIECTMCGPIGIFTGPGGAKEATNHLTAHGCDLERLQINRAEER